MSSDDSDIVIRSAPQGEPGGDDHEADGASGSSIVLPRELSSCGGAQVARPPRAVPREGCFGSWILGCVDDLGRPQAAQRLVVGAASVRRFAEVPPGEW